MNTNDITAQIKAQLTAALAPLVKDGTNIVPQIEAYTARITPLVDQMVAAQALGQLDANSWGYLQDSAYASAARVSLGVIYDAAASVAALVTNVIKIALGAATAVNPVFGAAATAAVGIGQAVIDLKLNETVHVTDAPPLL